MSNDTVEKWVRMSYRNINFTGDCLVFVDDFAIFSDSVVTVSKKINQLKEQAERRTSKYPPENGVHNKHGAITQRTRSRGRKYRVDRKM